MTHAKKFGFTLAEVLITLSIIGVVAAMTIPTLMNNNQKRTYVVGLKKAYSTLSNAMKMLPLEMGCPSGDYECVGWDENNYSPTPIDGQDFTYMGHKQAYLLSKVLKVNKFCPGNTDDCTGPAYGDTGCNMASRDTGMLVLDDGMILGFHIYGICVDVNGAKGPNKKGRDVFEFDYTIVDTNGIPAGTIIPEGSQLHTRYSLYDRFGTTSSNNYWKDNNRCTSTNLSSYCTGRVLEEDDMKY